MLTLINQRPSGGNGPCHLAIDRAGRNVVVANYASGSAAVLQLNEAGELNGPTANVQHEGRGKDPQRQEGPHAHSVNLDAANRLAFIADLGLDQVKVYQLDAINGRITPNDPPAYHTAARSRPAAFRVPSGRQASVRHQRIEFDLSALDYDADKRCADDAANGQHAAGRLPRQQRLPKSSSTQTGKFVYGSNRGHDSIAAFAIEPDGKLKLVGHQGEGVKTPRNFNIDPTGNG